MNKFDILKNLETLYDKAEKDATTLAAYYAIKEAVEQARPKEVILLKRREKECND